METEIMIKAEIKGKEVVYDQGDFTCSDPAVLSLVVMLSEQFNQEIVDYHPNPDLQMIEWVCGKTKGFITFVEEPDPIDPDVEY